MTATPNGRIVPIEERMLPKRGALAQYVELYTPLSEAPASSHLGAALALFSAAIGWKAWQRWAQNAEPCTLNVVIEGRSAVARKTTTANTAAWLLDQAMRGVDDSAAGLLKRPFSMTSNRGLLEYVGTTDKETARRWDDEPPPGIFIPVDEFGAILGDPGEIKGKGWLGQVRTTLMQLTNGRHGGVQTGQVKVHASRCAVSILGTMTRVELEQRISTGLLRDGFLGRFVLVPNNGRRAYLSEPPRMTAVAVQQQDDLIAWVRALAQCRETMGDVFDHLTDDAREVRSEWYGVRSRDLEDRAKRSGEDVDLATADAFNRLQTTALKIATVIAISEWNPHKQALKDVRITSEHVEYGHLFVEYALEEIRSLASIGGEASADQVRKKAITYLARNQPEWVQKKVFLDNVRHNGMSRESIWEIVKRMHPDDVEIEAVRTTGRMRHDIRIAPDDPPPTTSER